MGRTYIYPENLRARAVFWLWDVRDLAVTGICAAISVPALTGAGLYLPAAMTLLWAFLTMRRSDACVLDFLVRAVRYFVTGQQYFEWGAGRRKERSGPGAAGESRAGEPRSGISPASAGFPKME